MELTAMRQDGDLLKQCRRIFGDDLVNNAWVTTWDIGSTAEDVKNRLRGEKFIDNGTTEITDYHDMVIQFSNGRKIMFTNSEWASIALCDNSNTYQI